MSAEDLQLAVRLKCIKRAVGSLGLDSGFMQSLATYTVVSDASRKSNLLLTPPRKQTSHFLILLGIHRSAHGTQRTYTETDNRKSICLRISLLASISIISRRIYASCTIDTAAGESRLYPPRISDDNLLRAYQDLSTTVSVCVTLLKDVWLDHGCMPAPRCMQGPRVLDRGDDLDPL